MKAPKIRTSTLVLFCIYLLGAFWTFQETSATSAFADAFVAPAIARTRVTSTDVPFVEPHAPSSPSARAAFFNFNNDEENETGEIDSKFDMAQRIESLKSVVLGALSGGIALTPVAYLHYVVINDVPSSAQWEFTTDMSSLEAALFAIVYRYAVRANDNNPMLNQGVVGAFVVVRTLSNIQVTDTCQSVPLRCK
jgi:hypothetical protein